MPAKQEMSPNEPSERPLCKPPKIRWWDWAFVVILAVVLSSVSVHAMLFFASAQGQDRMEKRYLNAMLTQLEAITGRQHRIIRDQKLLMERQMVLSAQKAEELKRLGDLTDAVAKYMGAALNGNKEKNQLR